jgi:hypothetical protein
LFVRRNGGCGGQLFRSDIQRSEIVFDAIHSLKSSNVIGGLQQAWIIEESLKLGKQSLQEEIKNFGIPKEIDKQFQLSK